MNLLNRIFPRGSDTAELRASSRIRDEASAWLARRDAGFSVADEPRFQSWLRANPLHSAAFERVDETWKTLDRPSRFGSADSLLRELAVRGRRRRQRRAIMAAAALVLIVVGVQWQSGLGSAVQPRTAVATTATLLLPVLELLPDGTVAELRDGAKIAVEFSEKQRRVVLLGGEAYFTVTKNPSRPFVVVAGTAEVVAVGTAFSVNRSPSEVEVLVTEGKVAVDAVPTTPNPRGSASPQRLLLGVGEGAVVRATAGDDSALITAMPQVDLESRLAWRSPRLEFSGTPLVEVVALINRHNRLQFRIDDPELARQRVSGVFGAENTGAFVRLLEVSFNVVPQHTGANEIVLRRKQ